MSTDDNTDQSTTFGPDPYQPIQQNDLPSLNDVILDEPTLLQLFEDIRSLTQIIGISARGHGKNRRADDKNIDLNTAIALFLERAINALQIRYLHDGQEWWDTIMHTPNGPRLVRIQQNF